MKKKLYRSHKDRILSGLLGGFAEYIGMESTIVRLAYIFLTLVTGVFPFVIFYIIALFVVPEAPGGSSSSHDVVSDQ